MECSNDINCIVSCPISEYIPITESFISIPSDDSLSGFIHWNFGDYFNDKIDATDHNNMKKAILNLIITVLNKNTNLLSNSYKLNDNQPNQEPRQNVENH